MYEVGHYNHHDLSQLADDAYDELEVGHVLMSATATRDLLMEDRKPMKTCFDSWKKSRRSHEAASSSAAAADAHEVTSSSAAAADAHEVTSSSGTDVDEPLTLEEIRLLHEQVDEEDDEMQRLNEEVASAPIHVRLFCGPRQPVEREMMMAPRNPKQKRRFEHVRCTFDKNDVVELKKRCCIVDCAKSLEKLLEVHNVLIEKGPRMAMRCMMEQTGPNELETLVQALDSSHNLQTRITSAIDKLSTYMTADMKQKIEEIEACRSLIVEFTEFLLRETFIDVNDKWNWTGMTDMANDMIASIMASSASKDVEMRKT
jgi:hypothetical protein